MREIKFRALEKHAKRMAEVTAFKWQPDHLYHQVYTRAIVNQKMIDEWYAYDFGGDSNGIILMQYTGLKDKNGIEIYEGDILEFEDTGEEGYEYLEGYDFTNRAAVCYENGRFELENFAGGDGYVLESMSSECHEELMITFNNSKVIGNRFENPELLKEEPTC